MSVSDSLPRKAKLHIEEAHGNYKRYELLKANDENRPWAGVLLFYSALHLIQAHKICLNPHAPPLESHQDRLDYVWDEIPEIYDHYNHMYQISRTLRYKLRLLSEHELMKLHDDHFAKIRRTLRAAGFAWPSPITDPQGNENR